MWVTWRAHAGGGLLVLLFCLFIRLFISLLMFSMDAILAKISFTSFSGFFGGSLSSFFLSLYILFGYTFFVYFLCKAALDLYTDYRQNKNTNSWDFVVLAIDIPPMNIQTPKAVEQLFAHLAGIFSKPNIALKYRGGHVQRSFSFEIVSIDGYIQFLVHTEKEYRELVEAALYAQYPNAEITEVEDYVRRIPDTFPDEHYDIWATDIGLAEHSAYPIRMYSDFEHGSSEEEVLKDPMSALLESFSRIGSGEQIWLQIIVEPISSKWKEEVIEKINEILGNVSSKGPGPISRFFSSLSTILGQLFFHIFGGEESANSSEVKNDTPGGLSPGVSKVVQGMEDKMTKVGLKTNMRAVYIGKKSTFSPQRGINALLGSLNQFSIPTANAIVPTYGVSTSYFKAEKRSNQKKNTLMEHYKKRKIRIKNKTAPYILNVEELASIWHFPLSHVKTPLLQVVASKPSEPPVGLPIEMGGVAQGSGAADLSDIVLPKEGEPDNYTGPPPNLPFG